MQIFQNQKVYLNQQNREPEQRARQSRITKILNGSKTKQDYGTRLRYEKQDYGFTRLWRQESKKLICGMRGRYKCKDSALTVSERGNYILWGSDQ